ncbi:putative groEL-like equatorial domain superfamily [Helianthus anomalus]
MLQGFSPLTKSMIELIRTQYEEVGDGTTSVIVLERGGVGGTAPSFLFNFARFPELCSDLSLCSDHLKTSNR